MKNNVPLNPNAISDREMNCNNDDDNNNDLNIEPKNIGEDIAEAD